MSRAVFIRGKGGPEVLQIADCEHPAAPGSEHVVVEVAAAGLNRADCLQRRGLYPAPPGSPPDIPGLEFSGRVVELGPGVTAFAVGDPVMGITGGGAMASHLVAHERMLIPVPDGVDLVRAAAIPEAFITAFDAMEQSQVTMGQWVLVHAAASGVGTAAVQLLHRAGARVIGTSRTAGKLEGIRDLGLHHSLLVSDGDFAAQVREHAPDGVDVIFDFVGAAYLEQNLRCLASRGCLVVIGLLGGVSATMPLGMLLGKRARIIGTVLRSRPLEEKIELSQRFAARIAPMFGDGRLAPVIEDILPMTDVGAAHQRLESNQTTGKLLLAWS